MDRRTDTAHEFSAILLDVLEAHGVRDVVCSPGSRNAPLLIGAAARPGLRKHVVIDERSAAYMALGMVQVGRKPVALVCTSGTALLNYGPAVAEAYYQGLPLIVISADRPQQWIDQDDSQTLRQFEALHNFVKKSYELPAWGLDDPELQWYANRTANDAMLEATSGRPGPVHVNVRIGEPTSAKRERAVTVPRVIENINADTVANREVIAGLARELARARVMLVAGFMAPDARMHRACAEFAALPNVTAMTETLSNLHLGAGSTDIDAVLTAYGEEELDRMAPDVVLTVGGALVSRKLKEYLRRNAGRISHWALGYQATVSDCFQSLTRMIQVNPSRLLHHLAIETAKMQRGRKPSDYGAEWSKLRERATECKRRYVDGTGWCGLRMFRVLGERIGEKGVNLFLSNGTSVRYAQLFGNGGVHAGYCNRGVSGIDGSVSTAIGGARMYRGTTLLVTGDMSLAYDIGALGLPDIPPTMKIIVADNGGGGIFRFIDSTSGLEERERYFCAAPQFDIRRVAEGFGWRYLEADNEETFSSMLDSLLESPVKTLLRVRLDGNYSAEALKGYMAAKAGEP